MSFVTGSSDGLGLMAAQLLIEPGHKVVLHARNQERARDAVRDGEKIGQIRWFENRMVKVCRQHA